MVSTGKFDQPTATQKIQNPLIKLDVIPAKAGIQTKSIGSPTRSGMTNMNKAKYFYVKIN